MAPVDAPSSAALSALSNQVADLGREVGQLAEASDRTPTESVAAALYDAERALRSARRGLERATRALG
ncbi:hypothetical protein PO878_09830 [Iamia majanohamensis]|uniref:Uncharacterized protein n=1 Tax=Iamia majanohamensis TaxID=467976 RepID=A0AAF0BXQ7_9ACTN|nr:hypothetical protein [Iamia majanohamensis]WCO69024.1 hypothetical protein PO878_09830 [Iamia majanohamensis]